MAPKEIRPVKGLNKYVALLPCGHKVICDYDVTPLPPPSVDGPLNSLGGNAARLPEITCQRCVPHGPKKVR